MLRAIAPFTVPFFMLAMIACSRSDPVDEQAANTAGLPAANEPAPDATGAPPANAVAERPLTETEAKIPAALHGRWGLTPGDCTSTRGDAKGLLIVGPADLKFYESRAVPKPDAQASADSISGEFAYTGEGQTWTKFQALELQGQQLVRTESSPMASFTYARCK